ncbi:hypothetical protein F4811DRAFT_356019 [Daldinia bambusicola]|nr:hypothetical protein F4811DRAFT_356019 [Daldinia bambusicola]
MSIVYAYKVKIKIKKQLIENLVVFLFRLFVCSLPAGLFAVPSCRVAFSCVCVCVVSCRIVRQIRKRRGRSRLTCVVGIVAISVVRKRIF